MPSTNVVQQVNGLYRGLREIRAAIRLLEDGGKITAMDLSPAPEEGATPGLTIRVTTAYMEYPQQMVTAILGYMATRRDAITQEIEALGFTVEPENTGEGMPPPDPGPIPEPPDGGEPVEPTVTPAAAPVGARAAAAPPPRQQPPPRQPAGTRPQIRPPGAGRPR